MNIRRRSFLKMLVIAATPVGGAFAGPAVNAAELIPVMHAGFTVAINGMQQEPLFDYEIVGLMVSFTNTLQSGDRVTVDHICRKPGSDALFNVHREYVSDGLSTVLDLTKATTDK